MLWRYVTGGPFLETRGYLSGPLSGFIFAHCFSLRSRHIKGGKRGERGGGGGACKREDKRSVGGGAGYQIIFKIDGLLPLKVIEQVLISRGPKCFQDFRETGPGFDVRTRCHMWVEFILDSHLAPMFISRLSGFPSSQKPTLQNSDSISCTYTL